MSQSNQSLLLFIKTHKPILYETLKFLFAILVLFCILTPTFMWADSNKLTNIHSSKQINTLIKFKSLRGENPDLYRTLKYQYRFEVNNCIEQLKTLDFHNSKYYRCKKIANDISVRID